MIQKHTMYKFKTEFAQILNIPANQVDRRQSELLEWLKNFYDYKFYEGHPKRIFINEIIGEYQPMPRKLPDQEALTAEKKQKYTEFTIAALGDEFKPNSQARVSRQAIEAFGHQLYGHSSAEAVAKRYVKEPFNTYGESDHQKVWVWYSTYEPIPTNLLEEWRKILREEHIAEDEAANAFYRQEQGQDVSKEKKYYKTAQQKFKERYGDVAVLVSNWKLKEK